MNVTPVSSGKRKPDDHTVYLGFDGALIESEKNKKVKITQISTQMSESGASGIQGKHIANRKSSQWPEYGDPSDWDTYFEEVVKKTVQYIGDGSLPSSKLMAHFEVLRNQIAVLRKHEKAKLFGLQRDVYTRPLGSGNTSSLIWTHIFRRCKSYGYALDRAVKISYDEKHFVQELSDNGKDWLTSRAFGTFRAPLRYGLVQGHINGQSIPLTQYVFCPREMHRYSESEFWFGGTDDNYVGNNKESGLIVHTSEKQIPIVKQHIQKLIDKAIDGDLSVIPSIHWWYVHLAPTYRGPGGIAEMLTNTLCRLHDIDLPPWNDGVAPSIEILLEPNEEKFCSYYHELFAKDQDILKALFSKPDPDAAP